MRGFSVLLLVMAVSNFIRSRQAACSSAQREPERCESNSKMNVKRSCLGEGRSEALDHSWMHAGGRDRKSIAVRNSTWQWINYPKPIKHVPLIGWSKHRVFKSILTERCSGAWISRTHRTTGEPATVMFLEAKLTQTNKWLRALRCSFCCPTRAKMSMQIRPHHATTEDLSNSFSAPEREEPAWYETIIRTFQRSRSLFSLCLLFTFSFSWFACFVFWLYWQHSTVFCAQWADL